MAKKKNKVKVLVPSWMGRHPFPPEEKRVVVITPDMEVSTVYGEKEHQVSSQIYISTDRVNLCDFSVPPAGYFEPPDIHNGYECYYILQGTATVFSPETGQVYQVSEGEALLIPKGEWHQTFNFTNRALKVLCGIAPQIWADDEMGAAIVYKGKRLFYKGKDSGIGSSALNLLGKWPQAEGEVKDKKRFFYLPPSHWLSFIYGEENHLLISFFASNNPIHMGKITIPAGRFSDPETHQGDEVIYLLKGELIVRIHDENKESVSQESYRITKNEKLLIPEGTRHQYSNFTEEIVELIFTISPGL